MTDPGIILVVEDDPDDQLLMVRALKRNNVANEVEIVSDGEDALAYLFASGRWEDRDAELKPALVLLDLQLPKIDGLEVLRQIRANEKTALIPVVILTTSKEEQDVVSSYRLGANSFIRKPVSFDDFAEAVRQLGIYWLILNESPV